jgi:hypothetical protein
MAIARKLTDTCTISNATYSDRGDRTKVLVASDVPCDFTQSSGRVEDPRGQWVSYNAYLHMKQTPAVNKGYIFTLDGVDYEAEFAVYIKDNNGNKFMQFVALNEVYAGT